MKNFYIILIILILISMANYGFRISKDGKDVKTDDDVDMVVTSKYPNLKGVLTGSGTVSFSDTIFRETKTITIAHGLGYMPTARVSVHAVEAISSGKYVETPYIFGFFDRYYIYKHKMDSTNLTITLERQNDSGGALTVAYKYFIYLDKGKL